LALAVLIVAGVGVWQLFLRLPTMGSGPAGPPVAAARFQGVWTERPVLLLGLGDSITDGYGASPGHSYFERLIANPPDEFDDMEGVCLGSVLPNLTVHNAAVSGSTSIDCLEKQIPALKPSSPEVLGLVVITTGGNDIIHMYGRTPPREGAMYGASLEQAQPWIENYECRLNTTLDRIDALFPGGCMVFLGNIYDPTDGVGSARMAGFPAWPDGLAILNAYNAIIREIARARPNVHLVDIHETFLGHGLFCRQPWREHYDCEDPHCWYYVNVEDPNDRGYDAIRRLFLTQIDNAFETRARSPAERGEAQASSENFDAGRITGGSVVAGQPDDGVLRQGLGLN
jgi:lysophospholipase L1-like esterase